MESLLSIEGLSFPRFSSRDARQTIYPVKWGEFRRTVNGDLKYVGLPGQDKYKSVINCDDEVLPPFHQNWVGQDAKIGSLALLSETHKVDETGVIRLHRAAVQNQIICDVAHIECEGREVKFPKAHEGEYVTVQYRPILHAKITHFVVKDHEWDNKVSWQLEVEEV